MVIAENKTQPANLAHRTNVAMPLEAIGGPDFDVADLPTSLAISQLSDSLRTS